MSNTKIQIYSATVNLPVMSSVGDLPVLFEG
jgi:hypothetical protein